MEIKVPIFEYSKIPILFIVRSFVSFFFDFLFIGGYWTILFHYIFIGNHTMASLLIATILSRVLSGIFNYQMNRHYVFRKQRAHTAFINTAYCFSFN